MFQNLPEPGMDPVLGSARLFQADPSSDKINMGIGVYRDDEGKAPVLASVKAAERRLLEVQPSKDYLSPVGNPAYNKAIRDLLFADDPRVGSGDDSRATTIQAPGGTGALRLAADFLRAHRGDATVWIPAPSWPNHRNIFATAGLQVADYPYYDAERAVLRSGEMLSALSCAKAGDVVILHACCHNPSGADLGPGEWTALGDIIANRGLLPIVDIAYLGFGAGLEEDLAGLRLLTARVPELIVASSCSKNFALYRERVGALTVVGANAALSQKAAGHVLAAARSNYSMPPDHGAAVVAEILCDPALRATWEGELDGMRRRLKAVRLGFSQAIGAASGRDFSFIPEQNGLFALVPMSPETVGLLREEHHIFVSAGGRLNLAGLRAADVERVANTIGSLLAKAETGKKVSLPHLVHLDD